MLRTFKILHCIISNIPYINFEQVEFNLIYHEFIILKKPWNIFKQEKVFNFHVRLHNFDCIILGLFSKLCQNTVFCDNHKIIEMEIRSISDIFRFCDHATHNKISNSEIVFNIPLNLIQECRPAVK